MYVCVYACLYVGNCLPVADQITLYIQDLNEDWLPYHGKFALLECPESLNS